MFVIAEYIWIGGNDYDLRSKSKTIYGISADDIKLADLPVWNFDGSSTNQATGINSEVLLIPVAMYNDPFRGEGHKLVLDVRVLVALVRADESGGLHVVRGTEPVA